MPDRISRINAALEGRYRIEREIGEGGMATVYLAEQSEPVQRQVALKVLRRGVDSEQVLARFEAERQALAVMDHPSIAKVFDAGVMSDGRPFFVMELVSGQELADFCDERLLTTTERVRLFVDICHAVQHAHQKGIIHRDLKPSNILVSEVDGRPLPRVIDFGIAKATHVAEFDGTSLTRADQVIGTPAYMSLEQIEGSGDVDTRSDVYSLGVLLYEILSGSLPYDRDAYRGWASVVSLLLRDPPAPARRFAGLADTQETISRSRSTTPAALRRELAGDLGWIVSRAMEKERDRRYETVNALALDLGRFLAHEPVRARGTTTAYVAGRFVRRHRLRVAFGATVAFGLIGFSIVTIVQANRISLARDEAETRQAQAEGLVDFMLGDLREKLEPIGRLDVLDDVGEQATAYFSSIPEEQFSDNELARRSQSLYQIGKVRLDQGEFESAVGSFAESLRLARALSDRIPDDPDRLFGLSQSHFYVGYAYWLAGDLAGAAEEFRGYMLAAERLVELEPQEPDFRLELGFAHGNLGMVHEAGGDLAGAAEAYAQSLEAKRSLVEEDPSNTRWIRELAETHNKLGVLSRKLGDYAGALKQHARELELKQQLLSTDPGHADWRIRFSFALSYTALARLAVGEVSEAFELLDRQVALLDTLTTQDPHNVSWLRARGIALRDRGEVLARLDRPEEAAADLDEAITELQALMLADPGSPRPKADLASSFTARADLDLSEGRLETALSNANEALAVIQGDPASTSGRAWALGNAHRSRGHALDALGRPEDAVRDWETALAVLDGFTGESGGSEFRPLRAELLISLGRRDAAQQEIDALQASGYADFAFTRTARKAAQR